MKELYKYLDKRKSIRTIDKNNLLTKDDLLKINNYLNNVKPLFDEYKIRTVEEFALISKTVKSITFPKEITAIKSDLPGEYLDNVMDEGWL